MAVYTVQFTPSFAVAHHILIVAYQMLRNGEDYWEKGADHFDRLNKPKAVMHLVGRLAHLGYEVTLRPAAQLAAASDLPPPKQTPPPRRRGRPCKCSSRGIICTHKSASQPPPTPPADGSANGNLDS